jgi:hypothetical protein
VRQCHTTQVLLETATVKLEEGAFKVHPSLLFTGRLLLHPWMKWKSHSLVAKQKKKTKEHATTVKNWRLRIACPVEEISDHGMVSIRARLCSGGPR